MVTKLKKSRKDRVIDGVCGGLAEYFEVDSTLVRFAFVLLIFINGIGILLYIILAIIMPQADKADMTPKETIQENVQEIGENLKKAGEEIEERLNQEFGEKQDIEQPATETDQDRAKLLGGILILLGLFFLLDEIRLFWWLKRDIMFSFFLILIGAWMLFSRSRGRK